ncbi:MAG: alpha/beta hydrolase [Thermoanaerobaculia bacterium]
MAPLFELVTATALRARGLRPETFSASNGWEIKVWKGGSPGGESWMLIHGLGATAATFLPLVSQLKADCEFQVPELSTLGGSRGPTLAMGIPQAAAALAELLEEQQAERPGVKVTVCGISLGGWIAVRLALARPDLVHRLLLVVPGGYRDQDWERIGEMVRVETYRDTAAIWSALFVRPPLLLRLGRPVLYMSYKSTAVRAALATLREEDAFGDEDLARLTQPTGLIWGSEDRLFLSSAGERMARAIPGARFYPIARAGHGVQWERPAEFFAAVERFRAEFAWTAIRSGLPPVTSGNFR